MTPEDQKILDRLVDYLKPPNAHAEVLLREHLRSTIWLIRKCQDNGMTDEQILALVGEALEEAKP